MSLPTRRTTGVVAGVTLIGSAILAIVALTVAAQRAEADRAAVPDDIPVAIIAASAEPIPSEAQVFRTRPGRLAIEPSSGPRRGAHPRSLATYRTLRAYSGAPPRIPHGLTPTEFQTGGCKTCHERGGFSQRFGAYVPLTPHAEMGACLQCHVGDAKLMAIALPRSDPSDRCRQCHAPGAMRWRDSTSDWRGLAGPRLTRTSIGRDPPPIPHESALRGNCLACHSSPSGVTELRTRHPERANCRQCHVSAGSDAGRFDRTVRAVVDGAGAS